MSGVWATVRLDLQQAQQSVVELERAVEEFAGKDVKIEADSLTGAGGAAPAVARVGREVDHAEERAIAQATRMRALRRAIARRARARIAKRAATSVMEGVGGAAADIAGAASRSTPLGWIVGAALVAGVVSLRLISGKPLEGTAESINRMVLGDEDDKARAARRTREWAEGSPVVGEYGRSATFRSQMEQVASIQQTIFEREEKGASMIREAFPVNAQLDLIILGFSKAIEKEWAATGGASTLGRVITALRKFMIGREGKFLRGFIREWLRVVIHV
jgi:hypothetical protein